MDTGAESMYMPYDEKLNIIPQDDSFIPIRLQQVAQLLREGGGHGRHRPA